MSSLALLLCLVFIAVLFKLDPGSSGNSKALWIPTIWMLIVGSRMVSGWFDQYQIEIADGSPLDRNVFLVLILSSLVIVFRRRIGVSAIIKSNPWLALYLAYCAAAILWSDYPLVSFKRYFKEIGNLVMAIIVLSEKDPIEAIRTLFKRCAYSLIPLSIVMFKYFPQFGRSYSRWTGDLSYTGVTNNKNSLGVLCAISGIGLLWSLLSNWKTLDLEVRSKTVWVQVVMLLVTLGTLIQAHSATSIASFAVGSFVLVVSRFDMVRKRIGYIAGTLFVLIVLLYLSGILVPMSTEMLGRDQTLTGRTDVWESVLGMVRNPIIGFGYSSFWLGDRLYRLWSIYRWQPTEAHDGYIEIYLDLGIIGIALIASVILASFRSAFAMARNQSSVGLLQLTLLSMAVLYNITESGFRPGQLIYFCFILSIAQVPSMVRTPSITGKVAPMKRSSPGKLSAIYTHLT